MMPARSGAPYGRHSLASRDDRTRRHRGVTRALPSCPRPESRPHGVARVLQLLIVLVLLLCNAFFAMSEMAVLTSRKGRLKHMGETSRGARKALHLAEHPEGFLSAVQLWISLLSL